MSEDDRGSGARTIALLKTIAECDATFTLSHLAAEAGLPPSSVHRLLQPLLRAGIVERASGQAYRAGSELLRIASLILRQVDVGSLARPILRRVWSEWEETWSLCVYKHARHLAIVVESIQTPHPLRFMIEPFTELSLTWGSLGRAILASLPDAEAAVAIDRPGLGPLSGQPPATEQEMANIIAEIRDRGFAEYRSDQMDVAGIAAVVYRGDGTVLGSVGITAPAQRLRAAMAPAMAQAVIEAADELSGLLGHQGPGLLARATGAAGAG